MDNISINVANRLYWLGRYTERAYTLIYYTKKLYDRMVDKDENAYLEFCNRLGITDKYVDKNDFIKNFISDKDGEFSIAYTLDKTYDNAVVLRDKLTSQTLAYIQLAYNDLVRSFKHEFRLIDLQQVTDDLMAFWGAVDDYIVENNIRDLIKVGKYAERIDLYTRFGAESNVIKMAVQRFSRYVAHLEIESDISNMPDMLNDNGELDYSAIECTISELFKSEVVQ